MTAQQPAAPRHRPVATILVTLPVLAVFAVGALVVAHTVLSSTTTEHATYSAGITALDVDIDGNLEIRGTAGDAVRLERHVNFNLQQPTVSETVDGDTLRISAGCQETVSFSLAGCSVGYVLRVPHELSVTARSRYGDVLADDLTGTLDLSAVDGNLQVANLGGTLRLESRYDSIAATGLRASEVAARSSGEIQLEFTEAPTTVTARSTNSKVDIALPAGQSYRVEAESGQTPPVVAVPIAADTSRRIGATAPNGTVIIRPASSSPPALQPTPGQPDERP